jgi:hypothetical protein
LSVHAKYSFSVTEDIRGVYKLPHNSFDRVRCPEIKNVTELTIKNVWRIHGSRDLIETCFPFIICNEEPNSWREIMSEDSKSV